MVPIILLLSFKFKFFKSSYMYLNNLLPERIHTWTINTLLYIQTIIRKVLKFIDHPYVL